MGESDFLGKCFLQPNLEYFNQSDCLQIFVGKTIKNVFLSACKFSVEFLTNEYTFNFKLPFKKINL